MTLESGKPVRPDDKGETLRRRLPPSLVEMELATILRLNLRDENVIFIGCSGHHDMINFETRITYATTYNRPGFAQTFSDSGSFIHHWP